MTVKWREGVKDITKKKGGKRGGEIKRGGQEA
jgi:hypothetical protein